MGEHVIKLPDVGEGVAQAELVEWHVKVGDLVREDAVLAAVMTDKATVEIPSPVDGKVAWLGAEIGDTVAVYFECDDLDERVERLARNGIPFEHGPRNQPWMWREARLRDPSGNTIFLYRAGEARRFPPWRMEE